MTNMEFEERIVEGKQCYIMFHLKPTLRWKKSQPQMRNI